MPRAQSGYLFVPHRAPHRSTKMVQGNLAGELSARDDFPLDHPPQLASAHVDEKRSQ